jgi:hypothetical protein
MITELPRIGRGRVSDARRREFQEQVAEVVTWMSAYVDRLGFAPVARSWLYAMESARIITKGEFQMAGKWLADQRKDGLIPLELVGADTTRSLEGHDDHDGEATPREYINRQLRIALDEAATYWPTSYWKHQQHFPILWTEKRDLVKLFEPELPKAVRRFASKGQADVNSRAALIRECQWAQENDLLPLILYCGDHDPMGLQISNAIVENLRPLARVMDWEWELDDMERCGRIVRFGLNADFINSAGLLWIDGLETSSGEDLADPKHKQHRFPYVQSYLKQHGARKVEANALIANPTAARALIREELWNWLSHAGDKQWQAENAQASKEAAAHADGIKRMLAMFDSAGVLYNPRQLTAVVSKGLAELPPSLP